MQSRSRRHTGHPRQTSPAAILGRLSMFATGELPQLVADRGISDLASFVFGVNLAAVDQVTALAIVAARCPPFPGTVQWRYTRSDLLTYVDFANPLIRCILLPSPTPAYFTSISLCARFQRQTHNPLVPCSTHGRPTNKINGLAQFFELGFVVFTLCKGGCKMILSTLPRLYQSCRNSGIRSCWITRQWRMIRSRPVVSVV